MKSIDLTFYFMDNIPINTINDLERSLGHPIKIAIMEDHEMFREGMKLLLSSIPSIEVVGTFSNREDLISFLKKALPDILLMDIKLKEDSGIALTEFLVDQFPDLKVVALSMYDDPNIILKMIAAGASGYLLKNVTKEELKDAIVKVIKGQEYYCNEVAMQVLQKIAQADRRTSYAGFQRNGFTHRELQVIELVCDGKTNKEISDILNLSNRTIETHRFRIMKKMGVNTTPDLVKYAIRHELYKLS